MHACMPPRDHGSVDNSVCLHLVFTVTVFSSVGALLAHTPGRLMSAFGSFIAKVKAGGAQALLGAMHHSGKFDSALKNMTVTSIDTGP